MDAEQRKTLLRYAEAAVAAELTGAPAIGTSLGFAVEFDGLFVTLRSAGRLRGCVGTFRAQASVDEVLDSVARSATRDPRFVDDPLVVEELAGLRVEVSVVQGLRRVSGPGEIVVGRDGVLIRQGDRSGCFLPKVAAERGWTAERFLEECCVHKARLAAHAWKQPDAELWVFSAEVVGEEDGGCPGALGSADHRA